MASVNISGTLNANKLVKKYGREIGEKIAQDIKQAFLELLREEYRKIIEESVKPGGWLFDDIYTAVLSGIYSAVYEAYTPRYYKRRGTSAGGLGSKEVMEVNFDPYDLSLTIHNAAECNSKNNVYSLQEIITEGLGYPLGSGGSYLTPRDFYAAAQEDWNADAVGEKIKEILMLKYEDLFFKARTQILGGDMNG